MTGGRIDDQAAEAVFTRRSARSAHPQLAAFTDAVRAAGARDVTPNVQLGAMLATGVFPDPSELPDPAARILSGTPRRVSGLPKWRRKKMALQTAMSTLLGKVAALSFAAKAAAVTTVAAASIGAAGAAGALPAPLQQPFDATVHAVAPTATPSATPDSGVRSASPEPHVSASRDTFGATVSGDAHNGGVDGRQISQDAKSNGRRPQDAGKPSALPSQATAHRHADHPSDASDAPDAPDASEAPDAPDTQRTAPAQPAQAGHAPAGHTSGHTSGRP